MVRGGGRGDAVGDQDGVAAPARRGVRRQGGAGPAGYEGELDWIGLKQWMIVFLLCTLWAKLLKWAKSVRYSCFYLDSFLEDCAPFFAQAGES